MTAGITTPFNPGDIVLGTGPVAAIATFQECISSMLDKWAVCWRGVLDEIDQIVSVKVRSGLEHRTNDDVIYLITPIGYLLGLSES